MAAAFTDYEELGTRLANLSANDTVSWENALLMVDQLPFATIAALRDELAMQLSAPAEVCAFMINVAFNRVSASGEAWRSGMQKAALLSPRATVERLVNEAFAPHGIDHEALLSVAVELGPRVLAPHVYDILYTRFSRITDSPPLSFIKFISACCHNAADTGITSDSLVQSVILQCLGISLGSLSACAALLPSLPSLPSSPPLLHALLAVLSDRPRLPTSAVADLIHSANSTPSAPISPEAASKAHWTARLTLRRHLTNDQLSLPESVERVLNGQAISVTNVMDAVLAARADDQTALLAGTAVRRSGIDSKSLTIALIRALKGATAEERRRLFASFLSAAVPKPSHFLVEDTLNTVGELCVKEALPAAIAYDIAADIAAVVMECGRADIKVFVCACQAVNGPLKSCEALRLLPLELATHLAAVESSTAAQTNTPFVNLPIAIQAASEIEDPLVRAAILRRLE